MGIRFLCPNGHKLNVKAFLAGRRGICPYCGAKFQIPMEDALPAGQASPNGSPPETDRAPLAPVGDPAAAFEQDLEAHVQRAEQAASAPASAVRPAAWVPQSSSPREEPSPSPAGQDRKPGAAESADPPADGVSEAASNDGQTAVAGSPASAEPRDVAPPGKSQPDPFADAPNAVWYVRPPSGGQFGPAQPDMMRNWLGEGRVSPETLVWREGWTDWREAGSVFPQLQPTSAAPEAPPISGATGGADSTASYRTGPRRRKNGPGMGVIIALAFAVVLLLVVLILILTGVWGGDPPEQDSSLAARTAMNFCLDEQCRS